MPERDVSGGSQTAAVRGRSGNPSAPAHGPRRPGRASGPAARSAAAAAGSAPVARGVLGAWRRPSWPWPSGRCSAPACWSSARVSVTGTGAVPRAEVLRAAGIKPGTPLARVDTAAVARRVERITQVLSAQVSRSWPDTVVITVRERTPGSRWRPAAASSWSTSTAWWSATWPAVRPGWSCSTRPRHPSSLRGSRGGSGGGDRAARAAATDPPPGALGGRAVAGRGHAAPARRRHGALGRHRPGAAKAAELVILMRTRARSTTSATRTPP